MRTVNPHQFGWPRTVTANPAPGRISALGFPGLAVGLAVGLLLVSLLSPQPVQAAEKYVTTPSGERVLLERVMLPGGVVRLFWKYKDKTGEDVLHGPWLRSYRNGEKRELANYAHGEKHGEFIEWGDHEVLVVQGTYDHGKLAGPITWYYPSGKKRNVESYERGELNGAFTWYFEEGGIREKGSHQSGQRHGPYREFHENGQVSLDATYDFGALSGEIKLYDEAGRRVAQGTLRQDAVMGAWACYPPGSDTPRLREDCAGKIYIECTCP